MTNVSENGRSDDERDEGADGLLPEQTRFVEAIADGQSVADAAKAVDRSPRTGRRWKLQPEVSTAIRARVSENLAQARAVLAAGATRAARSLVNMSDGTRAASAPRVSAARAVVESASRLCEIQELEARLTELEARLQANTRRFGS